VLHLSKVSQRPQREERGGRKGDCIKIPQQAEPEIIKSVYHRE
jgi:hypothetical protein